VVMSLLTADAWCCPAAGHGNTTHMSTPAGG